MEGVASMGGYRGSISMAADGRGLIEMDGSSRGDAVFYRATMQGDSLIRTEEWSGNMFQRDPNIPTVNIEWYDIGDMSAFDARASNTEVNMDDMTIAEILESFPVKDTYQSTSEAELEMNISEVYKLYNACNAIAEKVSALSSEEYALIALESPKIIKVENIYPSSDFSVDVHSMYLATADRTYSLKFSNLTSFNKTPLAQ